MKKFSLLVPAVLGFYLVFSFIYGQFYPESWSVSAQSPGVITGIPIADFRPAKVDFDAYEALLLQAKEDRKTRLVNLDDFLRMSKEGSTIILDTRSDSMYRSKHIKGAIHLNFSDFTQESLAAIIPSTATRILIYCNNNFDGDQRFFASKMYIPPVAGSTASPDPTARKPVTLALNIPTFINLFGYGYRNLYELSELVHVNDIRIKFEGTAVK